MLEVRVNGGEFDSLKDVHEYLAKELDFPGYYGKNFSALYDVLTDLCDDVRIVMDLTEVEDEKLLEGLEKMAEVMNDAADSNDYLEIICEEN